MKQYLIFKYLYYIKKEHEKNINPNFKIIYSAICRVRQCRNLYCSIFKTKRKMKI